MCCDVYRSWRALATIWPCMTLLSLPRMCCSVQLLNSSKDISFNTLTNSFVLLPVWIAVTIPGVFFCLFYVRFCLSPKIWSTQGPSHNSYSTHRAMLNVVHFVMKFMTEHPSEERNVCGEWGRIYLWHDWRNRVTTEEKSQWTCSFMGMFFCPAQRVFP